MRFNLRGALLVAAMIAAAMATAGGAARRFAPEWRPEPLALACLLIALTAGVVHYAARRERMTLSDVARYAAPELLAFAVIMRIAASTSTPTQPLDASLERWLYDPLSIFEPLFVLYLLLGLLAAMLTHLMLHDLGTLVPHDTSAAPVESGERFASLMAADRAAALRSLGQRFGIGGVVLLLALGIEAVNIEQPGGPPNPIAPLSALSMLAYIVCGFVLLSQARLALLQTRWNLEGAQVADAVAQRSNRASLLLIAGVTLAAALLPRSYGRALLDILNNGLAFVGYAVALLGYIAMWLFGVLLSLPAMLLAWLLPPVSAVPAAPPPPVAAPPLPPDVEREPRLLPALIFWLCVLALIVHAGRLLARRYPGLGAQVRSLGPLTALLHWLAELWRDATNWTGMLAESIRARATHERPAPPALPAPPRFDRLAAREQVRAAYRMMLRHAASHGLERRTSQTPYEYTAAVTPRAPDAGADLAELTEAFIRAQYSEATVSSEEAVRARTFWERLRRTLRRAER